MVEIAAAGAVTPAGSAACVSEDLTKSMQHEQLMALNDASDASDAIAAPLPVPMRPVMWRWSAWYLMTMTPMRSDDGRRRRER
jgi:hypothetical protein